MDNGKIRVSVQSPEGIETELTERSKMHYLDQDTFWAVLSDVWKRHAPTTGMTPKQFRESLSTQGAPRDLNAVTVSRPASIRFLEMRVGRRTHMKKIIEVQQAIQEMVWPYQNNCSSMAGSKALFLGAQTNRGLRNGCVVRRTFHEQYKVILERVHALAGCCAKELPYLGMYVTQLVEDKLLIDTVIIATMRSTSTTPSIFGRYEGGHLETLRNREWQSCAVPLIWTEFTADIIEHRIRQVTSGERFSVTLFTPSHLERLTERDWMNLESHGFPVHLYAEIARAGTYPDSKGDPAVVEESVAEVHTVDAARKMRDRVLSLKPIRPTRQRNPRTH